MALTEKLMTDLKTAMRAGDQARRDTLRMLRAAIQNEEVARRAPLDDEAAIEVLQREAKKRQEPLEVFRTAGREDLARQMEAELAVIAEYLPQPLGAGEIEALARAAIAAAGASDLKGVGLVMKVLMPQVKGRADGRLVNEIVRRLLGESS
ncbi:MAG: GatB/YqeY domain-containing protein [Anaerolineae bacterium]|nr:GatB/YqeY domain-containing protein [Anaerolineae bacterium]